jgi:hypothetical protein
MSVRRLGLAVVVGCGVAGSAWAACLPEGSDADVFTMREASARSASLLVVSGTLMTMDVYGANNLRRIRPVCEVATLRNGKAVYSVRGTSDAALPRVMASKDRKAPMFFLMTVPDLTGVLSQSNEPAGPLGYVLGSRDEKVALAFRAYDAIPPDAQLASDFGAALEGRISPMLRADLTTGRVQISVAKGAGEVAEVADNPTPAH